MGSVPQLSSFSQCSAVHGGSALAHLVAEESLQLLAETLSVLWMVRGTGGSFSLALNGFV